ncbi:MAG: coenzyme F420-0:L-glutamate ligase [Porticoccaceae bacterium]
MTGSAVQLLALPDFPLVQPGDDLAALIRTGVVAAGTVLADGDVLVIAQKIVSKAEGRYVQLAEVTLSARAREIAAVVDKDPRLVEVILSESAAVLRQVPGVLIVEHRLGFVMANAGVDASNIEHDDGVAGGRVLLLPLDPDAFAARLRADIRQRDGVDVAVIVNDSVGRAWRNGTTSIALGAAGVPSLWDRRGNPDLFGRALQVTEVAVADELAAAAALVQGEGSEGRPVVLIRGLQLPQLHNNASALLRPRKQDLFR